MDIKKLLAAAGAGAILLGSAIPIFANDNGDWDGGRRGGTDIRNWASVRNTVDTSANTGGNSIGGKIVLGGDIDTGDAGALSTVWNDVNYTLLGCDCVDGKLKIRNGARVSNDVTTSANTGDNRIGGKVVVGGDIDTGDAGATSVVTNFVNTTMVGDGE